MTNEPIVLKKPAARIDLAAHYADIGERSLKAAHRFHINAEMTLSALARTPGMGAPYETNDRRLSGLRCFRVKRFRNHLIFYMPLDNGIEVIRVLHAFRDIQAALQEDLSQAIEGKGGGKEERNSEMLATRRLSVAWCFS